MKLYFQKLIIFKPLKLFYWKNIIIHIEKNLKETQYFKN
jgi:hypothetical protein